MAESGSNPNIARSSQVFYADGYSLQQNYSSSNHLAVGLCHRPHCFIMLLNADTPYEIRKSPNKGLGLFSTRHIPYETIIMRDPLSFWAESEEGPVPIYRRFSQLSPALQHQISKLTFSPALIEKMAPYKAALIKNGLDEDVATKVIDIYGIISNNIFELKVEGKKLGDGLFLNASRFNHSCVPNTTYEYDPKSECKIVKADCDIDAGEELTLSYTDPRQLREERATRLKRGWNFECLCPACDVNHPKSIVHEHERNLRRRRRFYGGIRAAPEDSYQSPEHRKALEVRGIR